MESLQHLAQQIGQSLKDHHYYLAVAESCTGGQLCEAITAIPGSSSWFERGFITYSNDAKQDLLSVPKEVIGHYGAVSSQVAVAMAEGALKNSRAQVSIAVTGIAGPEGGTVDKPVGTVWIAWCARHKSAEVKLFKFEGDRQSIRRQAVVESLKNLLGYVISQDKPR